MGTVDRAIVEVASLSFDETSSRTARWSAQLIEWSRIVRPRWRIYDDPEYPCDPLTDEQFAQRLRENKASKGQCIVTTGSETTAKSAVIRAERELDASLDAYPAPPISR